LIEEFRCKQDLKKQNNSNL